MAADLIYAFRVMRLPLLDAGGATIGRIQDIVAVPGRPGSPPRVVGFVAESQLRRMFDRYDVTSRTALVRLAGRQGWLDEER